MGTPCADCGDSERRVVARDLCARCYKRWSRSGGATRPVEPRVPAGTPCVTCGRVPKRRVRGECGACYMTHYEWPRHEFTDDHVTRTADGCWIDCRATNKQGYVYLTPWVAAHRLSYEHHKGSIPQGWHLDHDCHTRAMLLDECSPGVCDHRRCVNPEHLVALTRSEHMKRRVC